MNSELEKLIEKYRITVNGLADLESDYEKVIKERGFVTLNGLLAATTDSLHTEPGSFGDSPTGEGTENAVNTGNTPAAESDSSHNEPAAPIPVEPTPVVPAPSDNSVENTPVAPAVPAAPSPSEPATEQPGVTPVVEGPVSGDANLGNESAAAHNPSGEVSGERSAEPVAASDDTASTEEENSDSSEEETATGRKA